MQGMLGSIPPLDDIFKSAGMQLPDYLKGKQVEDVKAEQSLKNPKKSSEEKNKDENQA
jgi:flotillin